MVLGPMNLDDNLRYMAVIIVPTGVTTQHPYVPEWQISLIRQWYRKDGWQALWKLFTKPSKKQTQHKNGWRKVILEENFRKYYVFIFQEIKMK